jgi:hypothetical protein
MKWNTYGLKGVTVDGQVQIELNKVPGLEFEIPQNDQFYKSYVLSAPGDTISIDSRTFLEEDVEEFVDLVVDGILRNSSAIKTGNGKKPGHHVLFDRVLFYRFNGDKKKGLKTGVMKVQVRNSGDLSDEASDAERFGSIIGTIELQYWRKYPKKSLPGKLIKFASASSDRLQRASNYEQSPRWRDKCKNLARGVPQDFEIG